MNVSTYKSKEIILPRLDLAHSDAVTNNFVSVTFSMKQLLEARRIRRSIAETLSLVWSSSAMKISVFEDTFD